MTLTRIITDLLALVKTEGCRTMLEAQRDELTIDVLYELFSETLHIRANDPKSALAVAELTVQLSHHFEDEMATVFGLWTYASGLLGVFRHEEVIRVNQEIIQRLTPLDDWVRIAGARCNQIESLRELGRLDEALATAEQVRIDCAKGGSQADKHLPNLNMTVANVHFMMGEFDKALDYALEAYQLALEQGWSDIADFVSTLGFFHLMMDHYEEAERWLYRALALTREDDDLVEHSLVCLRLGYLHRYKGEYHDALRFLEEARSGKVQLELASEVAFVDHIRSSVYLNLNLLEETVRLASEARETIAEFSLPALQVDALLGEGKGLLRMERFEHAATVLQHAKSLLTAIGRHHLLADVNYQLALSALLQGRIDDAIVQTQAVLSYEDLAKSPSLSAKVHLLMTRCALADQDVVSAESHLAQAHQLATQYNLREIAIQVHYLTGLIKQPSDLQTAHYEFEQAVEKIAAQNANLLLDEFRIGYLSDKTAIYDALITASHERVYADQMHVQQLLYALDQAHSAPLSHRIADDDQQLTITEQAHLHDLRTKWNWYQTKLDKVGFESSLRGGDLEVAPEDVTTHEKLRTIEYEIAELLRRQRIRNSRAGIESQAYFENADGLLSVVQAKLKPDEALLSYYIANNYCHVIIVTYNRVEHLPDLAEVHTVEKLLETWRFHVQNVVPIQPNPLPQLAQMYLSRLYDGLFRPISPTLSNITTVNITLPTDWHDLPMPALFDGQQYLIERFALTHLSAPTALLRRQNVPLEPVDDTALIVGYSDDGRLPETLQESFKICEALPSQWDVTHVTESEATEQSFRRHCQQATLIHLATHATFRPDNPLFSWLRFADKHITVTDIYDMKLHGKPLVVLSACETGRGKAQGGGVLGMGRGLLSAGASQVVLSRWQLEDAASAELMQAFYQQLSEDRSDVAAALRQAQIDTLAQHPHPFFWASYMFTPG